MKTVKKIVALALVLMLTLSLSACGEVQKAEASVRNMFAALKALDFEAAQQYINVKDLTDADNEKDEAEGEMFMRNLFDKMEYEIIASEKVDDNTVHVQAKVTNIDMQPVFGEYIKATLQYAFSNLFADPQPTEEEQAKKAEELLVECLSKPDLATVTKDVTIRVTCLDKAWRVIADEELVNAMFGGLMDATASINEALSALE